MAAPKYTIIVPTLDEGEVVGEFLERLLLLPIAKSSQIIVADSGSADNTRDEVGKIMADNKNVQLLDAPLGKGIALRLGFSKAKAKNIIFIDADLQYPPEEIRKVADALAHADLVVTKRKTALLDHRRMLSLGFSQIIGKGLLSLPSSDPQSGLKGIKKSLLSKFSLTSRSWELDAELIRKAQAAGAKIKEVEIDFQPRAAGKSKTGIFGTSANLLSGALGMAFSTSPQKIRPEAALAQKNPVSLPSRRLH